MSDTDATGFAKFVPGFDFLQNLAKGASASVPQMPNMGNWVAPTLNVEELDKRIEELKNVQFWLEQNSRALSATIQALEVQRMTLATLKGMNFDLSNLANAFQMQGSESAKPRKASEKSAAAGKSADAAASAGGGASPKASEQPAAKSAPDAAEKSAAKKPAAAQPGGAASPLGDPLQLWGALAQQFQHIAASALQEVTAKAGIDLNQKTGTAQTGTASAKTAGKPQPAAARKPAGKKTARKPAPR